MDLANILSLSYADKDKQQKEMSKLGYKYDSMLSNGNSQIYYNPNEHKLLNSITGTHNLSDWGTDAYLLAGHLKNTDRYKDAHNTLNEAKKKYMVDNAIVAGHSLGGSIASGIASKNDKVYSVDAGYTFGQKTRSHDGNHQHYRSSGDLVSSLSGNAKNMTTLNNPHGSGLSNTVKAVTYAAIHPLVGALHLGNNILKAHDVNNIGNKIRV